MGMQISALHVRRSSLIEATPERVWREFTSFERLAAWFGRGHQLELYEPELGGQILLSVEINGAKRSFGGPILIFEPARELTFSNNWESGYGVGQFRRSSRSASSPSQTVARSSSSTTASNDSVGTPAPNSRGTKPAGTPATWKRSRQSWKARSAVALEVRKRGESLEARSRRGEVGLGNDRVGAGRPTPRCIQPGAARLVAGYVAISSVSTI